MKIEESIKILQSITFSKREDRSLDKVKKRLFDVLHDLKSKDLTDNKKNLLEKELESLFSKIELEEIDKKGLQTRYKRLTGFVYKELFLVPDGHYIGSGMTWGMIFGTFILAFSIILTHSILKFFFPLIGLIVGMLVGSILDSEAKKQNRTVKMKIY